MEERERNIICCSYNIRGWWGRHFEAWKQIDMKAETWRDDRWKEWEVWGAGPAGTIQLWAPFFTVLSGAMRNLHFVIIDKGSCLVLLTQKADDFEILGLWKKLNPNGEFVYRETRSTDTFFIILHSEHLCLLELAAISESRRALRVLSCHSSSSLFPYDASAAQSWLALGVILEEAETNSTGGNPPLFPLAWFHISFFLPLVQDIPSPGCLQGPPFKVTNHQV